jgi:hypothetical protein
MRTCPLGLGGTTMEQETLIDKWQLLSVDTIVLHEDQSFDSRIYPASAWDVVKELYCIRNR